MKTPISPTTIWIIILGLGTATFAARSYFILLFGKRPVPPPLQRALRFVPPAVLSALVLPDLLYQNSHFDLSLHNYRLLAGVVAAFLAWRTRNVLVTLAAGMVTFLALQALKW